MIIVWYLTQGSAVATVNGKFLCRVQFPSPRRPLQKYRVKEKAFNHLPLLTFQNYPGLLCLKLSPIK
jgi:hypothetical protein